MLDNAVAVVTGGASGLGLAIAKLLHTNKAIINIFDNNASALEACPDYFTKHLADVTDHDKAQQAINQVISQYKRIDILINNAGFIYNYPLINILSSTERVHNYESYKKVIDINMHSVFLMTSLVTEKMILSRTKGVIINMSSVCSRGNAGQSAYSAAKAGVEAFTKAWAKELGVHGIRVSAVSPGFINTPSTQSALAKSTLDNLIKAVPLRKLGEADNVAQVVLSIITNNYINGSILDVNGGFSL